MRPADKPRRGRPRTFLQQTLPSRDRAVVLAPIFKVKGFRREVLIDLSDCVPLPLVTDFSRAIQERCGEGGEWRSEYTIQKSVHNLRFFFAFLNETGFNRSARDLTAKLIDEYEMWLVAHKSTSPKYARSILSSTIVVMRTLEDSGRVEFEPELSRRLSYVSETPWEASGVRDAYHPIVTQQLRSAARSDLIEIRRRFLRDDSEASQLVRNLLAEIDRLAQENILFGRDPIVRKYCDAIGRVDRRAVALELNARHHLTIDDAISFIVLLSIDTGMEQESIKDLASGCVKKRADGRVVVDYVKNRARGNEFKSLPVSEVGKFSPASTLRTLEEVTALTRLMTGMPYLLTYVANGELQPRFTRAPGPALARWVKQHGIIDEDGNPIVLNISRLRKDNRSILYKQTGGDDRFVVNHTKAVAHKHYGNVPRLQDLHEQAVVDGLNAAFDAPPTVVPDDVAEVLPQTWVAACKDPDASPHGSVDGVCASPFWGCLDCGNAVFSESKIPALTAFALAIRREREVMTEGEWRQKFGRAYLRITGHILPKLPEEIVAAALERAPDEDALYLPTGVLS